MAESKMSSVYLGSTMDKETKKRAKNLGISRGEYLRACIIYAMYPDAFDRQGINADNLETVRAIYNSDFNGKYIDFLRFQHSVVNNASTNASTNDNTDTPSDKDTDKPDNTDTNIDTNIQTEKETEKETDTESEKKTKKGVGKSKIPPAKEIVFEGTTI